MIRRILASIGLATSLLKTDRGRTLLGVTGVALAVLATTLMASMGYGVIETGQEKFEAAGQDLWITSKDPTKLSPGSVGGIRNSITGTHELVKKIEDNEDVRYAVPYMFQTIYASSNGPDTKMFVGVGVPAVGSSLNTLKGTSFQKRDTHYADGSYDGPMTYEAVLDPRVASALNVSTGEGINLGGTVASTKRNRFKVVGTSRTISRFLGVPTITIHLSELQEITGKTGIDTSTYISVNLEEGANPGKVKNELKAELPDYQVKTNREQMTSIVQNRALLIGSAIILVAIAILGGTALTVNLMMLTVYQQRREIAALKALGISSTTLVTAISGRGLAIGLIGGGLGLLLTPAGSHVLNEVAIQMTGYEGLVKTPTEIYIIGAAMATTIGALAAGAAAWRISRIPALKQLDQ